jgi:hypothetical protein
VRNIERIGMSEMGIGGVPVGQRRRIGTGQTLPGVWLMSG